MLNIKGKAFIVSYQFTNLGDAEIREDLEDGESRIAASPNK